MFVKLLTLLASVVLFTDAATHTSTLKHVEVNSYIGLPSVGSEAAGVVLTVTPDDAFNSGMLRLQFVIDDVTGSIKTASKGLCISTNSGAQLVLANCGQNDWKLEVIDNARYSFDQRWFALVSGSGSAKLIGGWGAQTQLWDGSPNILIEMNKNPSSSFLKAKNYNTYKTDFGVKFQSGRNY
jgi:hypothetical protein